MDNEKCEWDPSKHKGKECPTHDDNYEDDVDYQGEYGNTTTKYRLEGFGYVSKAHYDKAVEQGRGEEYKVIREKTPVQNLPYAKISKPEKIAKMTSNVNPFYDTDDYKWTYNCQRCVVAWEMRYRGYDVTAKARLSKDEDTIFNSGNKWSESFKNFQWKRLDFYYTNSIQDNVDIWERNMKEEGNGARFIVRIVWRKHRWETDKNLYSHVINAIVNPQGQIEYYDGQSGKKFKGWHKTRVQETKWARVDNLELTDKVSNCVYDKGEEPQDEYERTENIRRQKEEYKMQEKARKMLKGILE